MCEKIYILFNQLYQSIMSYSPLLHFIQGNFFYILCGNNSLYTRYILISHQFFHISSFLTFVIRCFHDSNHLLPSCGRHSFADNYCFFFISILELLIFSLIGSITLDTVSSAFQKLYLCIYFSFFFFFHLFLLVGG